MRDKGIRVAMQGVCAAQQFDASVSLKTCGEKQSALQENHLRNDANGGPFLAGQEPCSACFALAPQLNHCRVATKAIKVSSSLFYTYDMLDAFIGMTLCCAC